uniref:Odorant receptor n=1 Tax=Culex quinquefasciatus TaxID=7176 RepID=A0A1S4KGA7_CULQU
MEASTRSRLWSRCKSRATAYYRALTRDFNYSTDFFFGQDFLLAIAGARLNSTNVRIRRWWNAYRLVSCLPMAVVFWNTFDAVRHCAKLEILLSCVQAVIGIGISALRMTLILRHYDSLMAVLRYVNRRSFGRILQPSLGTRAEAFYHIRRTVIPAVSIVTSVIASYQAFDFSHHHFFKLPFDIRRDHPHVQKLFEKLFILSSHGIGMLTVVVYLIVYMVLKGLTCELKVIAQTFSVIFENTENRVQRKLELEPGNSRQHDLMKKRFFWKFVQEEFGDCVKLHIEFLALLNRIRPFLNATFLIVYYSTVLSLASGAIYVSQMKSITLFTVATLYFCFWVSFECASLTRAVSILTESHESIGWEVYNLDWHEKLEWDDQYRDEYRSVRATMLNVMTVAQQPLRLNCFGFFEFTQDRFYELLNMAYSMFTFFRKFV